MCAVAHDYKVYHKNRIYTEQRASLPEVLYPTIQIRRIPQYLQNRALIEKIRSHTQEANLYVMIQDAVADAAEDVNAKELLNAYMSRDVDAMFRAICKYDLEDICAKARIIPDTKEIFFTKEDGSVPVFTFWNKDSLSEEEFRQYLYRYHEITDDAWKLVQSAIRFAKASCKDLEQRKDILWAILKDSIGVQEEVVRLVDLSDKEVE